MCFEVPPFVNILLFHVNLAVAYLAPGLNVGFLVCNPSPLKGMGPLQPWLASCLRDGVSGVAVATHCSNS